MEKERESRQKTGPEELTVTVDLLRHGLHELEERPFPEGFNELSTGKPVRNWRLCRDVGDGTAGDDLYFVKEAVEEYGTPFLSVDPSGTLFSVVHPLDLAPYFGELAVAGMLPGTYWATENPA